MSRYLNSADALHTLKHLVYETALNQHYPYIADVFEDIAKNRLETWVDLIPTADVPERNVGKWKDGCCTECGYNWGKDAPIASVPNYCPNCGADMRKETEDA